MTEHGKLQIYISVKKPLSYGTVFLHNPSSPYRSHQAWDLKRGCFFLCRIPYAVPCCLDLLFTHSVTNVTHSLGLGLTVFRPVLPVSLLFSRGSVPTLFDSTIYLHFNIFFKKKNSDEAPTISVSEAAFSLGVGVQIRCMDFCHTWF